MATFNGKYVVWGVNGITATGFVTSGDEPVMDYQSVSVSNTSDVAEVKNGAGDVSLMVFSNHNREASIEVVPSGTSLDVVQGDIDELMPIPGTIITLGESDAHLTTLDGETGTVKEAGGAGMWSYMSGELTRSNDAEARISMVLKQYAGCDLDATLTVGS